MLQPGGPQAYGLSILSCLRGLSKAIALGWYIPDTFDADQYEYLSDELNANMHEISPKFIAFKGPVDKSCTCNEEHAFSPEHFVDSFQDMGVTAVVRLNEPSTYDPETFTKAGLRHYDLYFDVGTPPSNTLLKTFLEIARCESRLAIHCRGAQAR